MNHEEEKNKAIWRQHKEQEIIEELKTNKIFCDLLQTIYPTSRDGFTKDYARAKVRWIEWGPKMKEWIEREDLKWINNAGKCLEEILQKKLFDLQCLWRAEKIQLPEIRVTYDFIYWEKNILNCPFLEPISENELNIYMQYMQSSNFEFEEYSWESWQNYREIKEAYNTDGENRNFPEWYDFYNGRTGASSYLLLPDIRGDKEEFYLKLWRKEHFSKAKQEQEQQDIIKAVTNDTGIISSDTTDKRPYLNSHKKGWLTWFVNTFEDKQTQEVFKRFGGERSFSEYDDLLEEDFEILESAYCDVPIESWFDWKEAIHKAAQKFMVTKINEALPVAYQQYLLNHSLNIFSKKAVSDYDDSDKNWYSDMVLRGRELNNEPRDFNF